MGSLYFLSHRKFYLNLLLAILILVMLFWGVFLFLKLYTNHGEELVLPDFYGLTLTELSDEGLDEKFNFVVLDSIFDPGKEKGIIIQQDPPPYSNVKKGRKVYVTIIALMPEKTPMPDLVDLSYRQAYGMLESSGLRLKKITYVSHFAENAVLEQLYNDEVITPGTLIEKGSLIELIIGDGYRKNVVKTPLLIAKKQKEAKRIIQLSTLNIGNEYFLDGRDTSHARVYKQEPSFLSDTLLSHGDLINIWYRSDQLFNFDEYLRSLMPEYDSTDVDSVNMNQF